MVKIVGLDEDELHRVTCKNCASILEYTMSEAKIKCHSNSRNDVVMVEDYIQCPKCDISVFLTE